MKIIWLLFVFLIIRSETVLAQEPVLGYYFRLFNKKGEKIIPSNKNYILRSLSERGCRELDDDTVLYDDIHSFWKVEQWLIHRQYICIQISEPKKGDTMNIFIPMDSAMYGYRPIFHIGFGYYVTNPDSIVFRPGNFAISCKPRYREWSNSSSSCIRRINGSIEEYVKTLMKKHREKGKE
jgi:hypothetical protein